MCYTRKEEWTREEEARRSTTDEAIRAKRREEQARRAKVREEKPLTEKVKEVDGAGSESATEERRRLAALVAGTACSLRAGRKYAEEC